MTPNALAPLITAYKSALARQADDVAALDAASIQVNDLPEYAAATAAQEAYQAAIAALTATEAGAAQAKAREDADTSNAAVRTAKAVLGQAAVGVFNSGTQLPDGLSVRIGTKLECANPVALFDWCMRFVPAVLDINQRKLIRIWGTIKHLRPPAYLTYTPVITDKKL